MSDELSICSPLRPSAELRGSAEPNLSIDSITGGWTIAQRVKGHRHSTDDLLTGWYAAENAPPAVKRLLDLGAGIGGVGLLALWRSPEASLVAVEAQEVSYGLLVDNVARNGLSDRVRTIHADLRATHLGETFDLVTGSPPYWDVSQGVLPADSQKAHARFELRGTVHDYALCAREHLAPHGRFVFCFPTVQRDRALAACRAATLVVERYRDVIPRAGAAALFTLFVAKLDGDAPTTVEPDYVVRDANGEVTEVHLAARRTFGLVR